MVVEVELVFESLLTSRSVTVIAVVVSHAFVATLLGVTIDVAAAVAAVVVASPIVLAAKPLTTFTAFGTVHGELHRLLSSGVFRGEATKFMLARVAFMSAVFGAEMCSATSLFSLASTVSVGNVPDLISASLPSICSPFELIVNESFTDVLATWVVFESSVEAVATSASI